MLGIGWTEMLVIGVVALIVIGPKELPALMQKLGRFAGTIRRMGADFQRELNKTTGLDEVRNLRTSITAPLKQTTDAIRKEFNTIGSTGAVQPSGVIKPADPKAESVVDEIKAAAGMTAQPPAAAAAPITAAPVKAKRVAKVKPAPTAPVATAELAPVKPASKRAAAKVKPVESPAPVEALAPAKKPAKAKPAAPAKPKAVAAPRRPATKKL
ncbi:MAG: Sec-independent protein translocase protein TatB [Devosia sp.]|nr:Sec-independent protein translocase protein TatB [Devosia sp.]